MSSILRGTSNCPGSDEPKNGIWCKIGDNKNVPGDEATTNTKMEQPWKANWPPKAFGEGTIEKAGEVYMRANQGAAIGRPSSTS